MESRGREVGGRCNAKFASWTARSKVSLEDMGTCSHPRQPFSRCRSLSPEASPGATHHVLESELIERVRAGDMAAARQLYDAHIGTVHRLAMRMTGDEALADDATQVAFIRAFRSLGRFRGDASFGTWVHRITVSATLNLIKGRKRWNARSAELDAAAEVAAHAAEPDVLLK